MPNSLPAVCEQPILAVKTVTVEFGWVVAQEMNVGDLGLGSRNMSFNAKGFGPMARTSSVQRHAT
jgi:hypothetical protein